MKHVLIGTWHCLHIVPLHLITNCKNLSPVELLHNRKLRTTVVQICCVTSLDICDKLLERKEIMMRNSPYRSLPSLVLEQNKTPFNSYTEYIVGCDFMAQPHGRKRSLYKVTHNTRHGVCWYFNFLYKLPFRTM